MKNENLTFKFLEEDVESDIKISVNEFSTVCKIAEFIIDNKWVGSLEKLEGTAAHRAFINYFPVEIVESYAYDQFKDEHEIPTFWRLVVDCDHYHEFYFRDLIITLIKYMEKYMDEIEDFFIIFKNRLPTFDTKKSFVTVLKDNKKFDVLENNERIIHYALKDNSDKMFIMLFYRNNPLKKLITYEI
jgi:hypothetical protein